MIERVLIVDDDPAQRSLLAQHVQNLGYAAVTAEDGDRAVEILNASEMPPIACMILDLVMPGLDGLGVLAHLRKAGLKLPVIVQTGHGGMDNAVSAMRAGAVDFLVKPIGTDRLETALRSALAAAAEPSAETTDRGDAQTKLPGAAPSDVTIVPAGSAARIQDMMPLLDEAGHIRPLEDIEAEVIRFAIARYGGQMSEVARRLRIGRSTLYRRLDSRATG